MAKQIFNNINVNGILPKSGGAQDSSLMNEVLGKLNSIIQPLDGYEFGVIQDETAVGDVHSATRDLDNAMNAINGKGKVYAIDVETIGNALERSMTGEGTGMVTEIGLSSIGPNGVTREASVLFGISPEARVSAISLLNKAQTAPWESLSDLERSDLDRLARASQSIIKDNSTGMYILNSGNISYDRRSISQATSGLEKLTEVWKNQGLTTKRGQDALARIQAIASNASSGTNVLSAYNGRQFDFPILEKTLGFKFGQNTFDPLHTMNTLGYNPMDFYKKMPNGFPVTSHYRRQTSLAGALGIDTSQAHTAWEDTDALAQIVYEGTLVKDLKNKSNEIMASKAVLNKNQPIFKVQSSLKRSPFGESGVSLDYKSMMDLNTGKEVIMANQDWILNRGRFYEVDSLFEVNEEFLKNIQGIQGAEEIAKAVSENKTLFGMKIRSSASGSNEYATIIRSSKEELYRVLDGRVSVPGKIERTAIDMAETTYRNDLARREWMKFFDIGGNGFDKAKQYYGSYESFMQEFSALGGSGKPTVEQLNALVNYGEINLPKGALSANKALTGLSYDGNVSFSSRRNFASMFNILGDTNEVYVPLLNNIERELAQMGVQGETYARSRSVALRIATSRIGESLGLGSFFDSKGNFAGGINRIGGATDPIDFAFLPMMHQDRSISRVNATSKKSLAGSIGRELALASGGKKFGVEVDLAKRDRALQMLGFYMDGVLVPGTDSYDKATELRKMLMKGHTDFSVISDSMAEILSTEVNGLLGSTTASDLENIGERIDYLKSSKMTPHNQARLDALERLAKIQNLSGDSRSMSMAGMGVDGKSVNVLAKNIPDFNVVDLAKSSAMNGFVQGTDIKDLMVYDEATKGMKMNPILRNHIASNFGYGEKEMENFEHFFRKVNEHNKTDRKNALAVTMNTMSNNGTDKHFLSIVRRDKFNEAMSVASRGELYESAVNIPLFKIKDAYGLGYIESGRMKRANTQKISMYFDKKTAQMVLKESTVAGEALSALNKATENIIYSAVNTSEAASMSRQMRRAINRPITKAGGFTGEDVYKGTGKYMKNIFVPNLSDYAKQMDVDISSLMNMAPFLYEQDKDFQKEIEYILFNKGGKNPNDVRKMMNSWKESMLSGNPRGIKGYEDVDGLIKEYMTVMMFHGKEAGKQYGEEYKDLGVRMIDRIAELDFVKSNPSNMSIVERLKSANMIMKETDVSNGMATYAHYTAFNTHGVFSDHNRPPQIQRGKYRNIFLDEIGTEKIKHLRQKGIRIGEPIMDVSMKSMVFDRIEKAGGPAIETSVSGVTKIFSEKEVYESIEAGFNDDMVKAIMKEIGSDDLQVAESIARNAKMSLYRQATTTEQGSILHPSFKDIKMPSNLQNFGYDGMEVTLREDLKPGMKLNTDDVIGTKMVNGVKENVYYGKRSGIIQDLSPGNISVLPEAMSINENKIIVNATEKSLSKVYDIEGLSSSTLRRIGNKKRAIEELVYERIFGKGTTLVAGFEFMKHESTSTMLGDIGYIADQILSTGNPNEIKALEDILKPGYGKMNLSIGTIGSNTPYQRQVFLIDQMKSDVNIYDSYNSIMDAMQNSNNESIRNAYNAMEKTFFDGKGRSNGRRIGFYGNIALGQNNVSFSSQIEDFSDELHKGVKSTQNSRQVFGTYFGGNIKDMDMFRKFTGDGYRRSTQFFVDRELQQVLDNAEGSDARRNLMNIIDSTRLNMGESVDTKIKTLNLADINIPAGGVSAEDLGDTLYGRYKDYNVVKVVLPEDMAMNNYFSPIEGKAGIKKSFEKTREIFIPMQTYSPEIDGEVYKSSETMRRSADLINALKIIEEDKGNRYASIQELKRRAEDALLGLHQSVNYEFNNKDGIMMSDLITSRLAFSGHEAIGGIYAPLFDKNGELMNKGLTGEIRQSFDGEKRLVDVLWMSERGFKKKAGDDIFERIGRQVHEGFDSNFKYSKALSSYLSGLNEMDTDSFERIGREYLTTVGLPGSVVRWPAFMAGSEQLSYIRLSGAAESDSVTMMQWLAKKMNADNDGDSVGVKLFLEKSKDGPRMYRKGSDLDKAFNEGMGAQSILNESLAKQIRKEDAGLIRKLKPTNKEAIETWMANGKDGFSYLQNQGITYAAVNTRYNKIAVGLASNPNKYLRDVAQEVYNKSFGGILAYNDLSDFTDYTEENIISIKHLNDPKEVIGLDRIGLSSNYYKSITEMTEGNLDGGFRRMLDQLGASGFFKESDEEIRGDVEKLYEKITTSDLGDLTKRERQARRVYDFFGNDRARELMTDPVIRSGNISSSTDLGDVQRIMKTFTDKQGATNIGREKIAALNYEKTAENSMRSYYSDLTGTYRVSDTGIGSSSALSYAVLQDVRDESNTRTIYADSSDSLARRLNESMAGMDVEPTRGFFPGLDEEDLLIIGQKREELSRAAQVAKTRNFNVDPDAMLRNFNDGIRQKAIYNKSLKVSDLSDELIGTMFKEAGVDGATLSAIRKVSNSQEYIKSTSEEIAQNIKGLRMYDMDAIRKGVYKQAQEIGEALGGGNSVSEQATTMFVDETLSVYHKANQSIQSTMEGYYSSLVNLGAEGQSVLGWGEYTDLASMGQQRIASGEFIGAKIDDLDLESLRSIMSDTDTSQAAVQTRNKVSQYFSALDSMQADETMEGSLTAIRMRQTDASAFLNGTMDMASEQDRILRQVNDATRAAADTTSAKKTLGSSTESIAKNLNMLDNKNIKIALGTALALGVASIATGQFTSLSSSIGVSKRPTGQGSPDVSGNYDQRNSPVQGIAPPSEKTFRAQAGGGMRFKVSGTINPNLSGKDISRSVGSLAYPYPAMSVNVTTKDERNIDQGWLERQFSNLL